MTRDTLWSLIEDAAGRTSPDKIAVWSAQGSLSYAELYKKARGVAKTLRDAGVSRGDRVGIWMDKTPSCLASILGVLGAGAAYVPLDPRAPWRRCRTIGLDSGFAAVVVDAPRISALKDFLDGQELRVLLVDRPDAEPLPELSRVRTERLSTAGARDGGAIEPPKPDDPAYILYTSGSTGAPKGVVHTHASGLAFTRWVIDRFGVRASDVFSAHAPFHFDLSISDLFASLGAGASVRLISSAEGMLPPFLVKSITEWKISVWYSVPSILVQMLDLGELEKHGLPTVETLFFAGEVFPTPQLKRLRRAAPHARLVNLFGPTETNVCTYYEVPSSIPDDRVAPIPIGIACEHMETFVVDDEGRSPANEGTLWVRGGNLMSGYWNDPARTEATLRSDPRGSEGLAYNTGDRVRVMPDGNYEFLGRRDHMIKTRGYRVELGEIEAALGAHEGVLEAVAVAVPDPNIGNLIVASVVPRSGKVIEMNELRAFCRQLIPVYMVPERVDVRQALPRTSTGKADRTALLNEWKTAIAAVAAIPPGAPKPPHKDGA